MRDHPSLNLLPSREGKERAKHKAVFLDRDGTINEEVNFLDYPKRLELIPGAAEAIQLLNEHSFKVIVTTNQSGIARGYFTKQTVDDINQRLLEILGEYGAFIDTFYYCPHHPLYGQKMQCNCRKPQPGMIMEAAVDHDVDLPQSYVIGDKAIDILAGQRAGCKTILVLTGYGKSESENLPPKAKPNFITADLISAVKRILEKRSTDDTAARS